MRNTEDTMKLIQHRGRLLGHHWTPTDVQGEIARRIDVLLFGGVQTETDRELDNYRATLPAPRVGYGNIGERCP